MTFSDLVERVKELESEYAPEGERPPELTSDEKRMLADHFDVDPWADR